MEAAFHSQYPREWAYVESSAQIFDKLSSEMKCTQQTEGVEGVSVMAGKNYTDSQHLHQNARFGTATRTCRYTCNLAWPQGSHPEELAMDDLGP